MKITQIVAACLPLLLTGCFMVPSPYSDRLNPAAARYSSIQKGSGRSELEAQFGKPSREERDGACVWETRFDDLNYAMLKVWFDHQDKVEKVEVTQAHGRRAPGYQASTVTTKDN